MIKRAYISIPNNYGVVLLKNKNNIIVYIYNKFFFFQTKLQKQSPIQYDRYTKGVTINYIGNRIEDLDIIYLFLKRWSIYFIQKIKFTGKGFKIVKKEVNNYVKFFFGKSHITWALFRSLKTLKIKKRKLLFISLNKKVVNTFLKKITSIKKLDLYTKRGLRFGKQIVHKRNSKKNSFR